MHLIRSFFSSVVRRYLCLAGIAVFLIAHLTGCAYHRHFEAVYAGPEPVPESISRIYMYSKYEGPYKTETLECHETYEIEKISFNTTQGPLNESHQITMTYYKRRQPGKTPVVVVLPILGGRYRIAGSFAGHFAESGYAALLVHRQKSYKENLGMENVDQTLKQIVIDHKLVLDWVETRPELDAERIGVFGVSMGSIKASLLTALDDRVSAAILGLVAGDMPYVLAYSSEPGIKKKRNAYMKAYQMTQHALYQTLKDRVDCDPMNYAKYLNAEAVMMILARFDTVMPYRKGLELWEKAGKPEKITILSGHVTAYPMIPYIKEMAMEFYKKQFEDLNPRPCRN